MTEASAAVPEMAEYDVPGHISIFSIDAAHEVASANKRTNAIEGKRTKSQLMSHRQCFVTFG
ncbi:hypothetical protein Cflav_PD4151 [Pedosphaera parvula Ellin514]|uniref:Uncharacterized protein n=1 Tax=Pedosphaera parvula (strain Ellin514) TaxID=320771 RepID=B9XEX5_PEDPL|nr:hypothetical protein Cflav_PD4151 [Pedosphaera parvula Ellin514]